MIRSNGTKRVVLQELMLAEGYPAAGELIGEKSGVSRQSVWKAVEGLRDDGYGIRSIPHKGYLLEELSPNDLDPTMLENILYDCPWGHPVLYWPSLASTQEPLKEMARQNAPEGAVITADEQTRGRGRLGRNWESPPGGGLYFSLLMRPRISPGNIQLVSLAAAMAVWESILELFNISCDLKWPNDILFGEAKLCGILTETASEPGKVHYAVTGIGLNANVDLRLTGSSARTASLIAITGKPVHRGRILSAIVKKLHHFVSALENPEGGRKLIEDYTKRCTTLGRKVRVVQETEDIFGKAVSLDERGALVVESGEGRRVFAAADIVHLRQNQ